MQQEDSQMYSMGIYNKIAYEVVMAHFGAGLAGKKSKAKYIEKPFSQEIEEKRKEPTEEELKKKREEFVAMFETIGANFRLSQQSGSD